MDLVTQIQAYVRALAGNMAQTVEYLYHQTPAVPANYSIDQIPAASINERVDQLFQLIVESDIH
jgi:hypothetical protein